jgi:thiol-disulfide isomerase/thioredoxin
MRLSKKSLKGAFLILLILTLLISAGCSAEDPDTGKDTEKNSTEKEITIGLTSFQTEDIYGTEMDQSIFKDYTLTMVNVWGTYCGPCLEEMPYLGELQNEYETKGVNIMGIVIDVQDENLEILEDQLDLAREIAEETGADYTHLIVSEEMIDAVLYQLSSIPSTFFVDSDGNIVSEFYIGAREKSKWADIIEENLEKL